MLDLILPNAQSIIKETFKKDTGNDCSLKIYGNTVDFDLYSNPNTNRTYLVQCSHKYDLFGFQNYKDSFPEVDTYIYVGVRFIMIHFADLLVKCFKRSDWVRNAMRDGTPDATQSWIPSMRLFNDIGGIIYDYQDWVLVDRRID